MSRSVLITAVLLGLVAVALLFSARSSTGPAPRESRVAAIRSTPHGGFGVVRERRKPRAPRADLGRRVPAAPRLEEIPERHFSQSQEGASAAMENRAARRDSSENGPAKRSSSGPTATTDQTDQTQATGGHSASSGVVIDYSKSAIERALTEAGLPPAAAADVKRRYDELAMDEVSLRNQATREGWVDTPEFDAELQEIEADRLAIRDEIGDEAYDHYLFATGQPNRVYVTEVVANSPAAQAGLQTSDVILSYGGARILTPDDLIAETEVGTMGEPTRIKITRNSQPLEVEVPRGPLGLRIGVTQEPPSKLGGH